MAQPIEVSTSEHLKIYEEILALRKLCENQENDLSQFDLQLSSLPVDLIMQLKELAKQMFDIGLQKVDQLNLETVIYEALAERIEYLDVIKNIQFENSKYEEEVNNELREIKRFEDSQSEISKTLRPEAEITREINLLENQIASMQEKQNKFSPSSLKCVDSLLLKLDQIQAKKGAKEIKTK